MIDSGIGPWPPEVLEAVARFKQGDLVERPPFVYSAAPRYGVWRLSQDPESENESETIELDPRDVPPFGLITTQTCDLVEEGTPKQPWFQVAPVYSIEGMDEGRRAMLRRGRVNHLVELTGSSLPDGLWVADLRVEFPLEKSWLVGRNPVASFDAEGDYSRLADHLSRRRKRPALATILIEYVVRPLKRWLDRMRTARARAIHESVAELRLAVAGNLLEPDGAALVVITESEPLPSEIRDAWDEWWDNTHEAAKAAGLPLLGNRYETLRTISAQDYLETVPLDFSYLSPDD
jgi:hypothetical protein